MAAKPSVYMDAIKLKQARTAATAVAPMPAKAMPLAAAMPEVAPATHLPPPYAMLTQATTAGGQPTASVQPSQ